MASGPRNPTRTREFYEKQMSEMEGGPKAITGPPNTTTSSLPAGSAKKTSGSAPVELSTSIPPARPPLNVPEVKSSSTTTTAMPSTTTSTQPPLVGMFRDVWDGVRGMLGIKKLTCLNGGKPKSNGNGGCDCPQYFNGTLCEKKQCLNGGSLQKVTTGPITYECQCPHPLYMEGAHCEKIRCANNALLITQPNGTWHCDCSQKIFYKGVFCEKFSPPMGIAIPLIIALVFLICCGLCRIDWCPRKRLDRRRDRTSRSQSNQPNRRRSQPPQRGRVAQPSSVNHQSPAQEFLLPGERALCTRNPVAFPNSANPYIIRLDTIPTFNPNMLGGVDPSVVSSSSSLKPIDPPPSYEQAVQAPPMPDPPRYSERSEGPPLLQTQPPPPSREPPQPPSA